jgi:hypothetical protein
LGAGEGRDLSDSGTSQNNAITMLTVFPIATIAEWVP